MSEYPSLNKVSPISMSNGVDTVVELNTRADISILPISGMIRASCVTRIEKGLSAAKGLALLIPCSWRIGRIWDWRSFFRYVIDNNNFYRRFSHE